ncbi:T9SS type A sorting domain-containing protein [Algoriphagus sp. H41]|uniref:T9SS type A sorting domain-containing protein n=1 Tax=Algoriphagus oliviformis TaxID=2811231 RepID=A0ABS3BZ97_9BACT|nr:FG-GAP-like repeat-containing protein [Algoriphagus oliviformis]MBN7810185.1 T9SS type A sorting domain-containing protein [Algoriphagus oliviformis]
MSKTLTLLFALTLSQAFPQTIVELDQSKTIQVGGAPIPIPFSLGINSAQIQTIDLTGDGIEEWAIWDINSRQLQVFQKTGAEFTYLPELSYFFPQDISGFFVLADFDQDGKKDLFTSTPLGIKAYRNTSQGTQVSWTLAQNFLKLDGANNIPVNNLDTPLLQDLDGDGDLDLVIFNFAQGDFLEFFKNTSVERKGTPDIDGFAFPVDFWGNMVFCGCDDISFGVRCDGRPIDFRMDFDENDRILHAGGHSILYQDFSGDGVLDLVIGRDECSSLYYLVNQGSNTEPLFDQFSHALPDYGDLPEFPIYHVGELISEDLIVSLNTSEASSAYGIDFAASMVKLSADGSGPRPVLQDQLYDLGENTRPLFLGNAVSGELWLTSNRKIGSSVQSQASRLALSGTNFELAENDFLGLSALNLLDVQLLDFTTASGTKFRLVSGVRTTNGVPSQAIYRSAGENWEQFSLSGLSLRVGDQLAFFTFGGKDQLLVAAQNGSLTLYDLDFQNGSATLKTANFLGFQDNPANRNLSVALTSGEKPNLYSVDQTGRIFLIRDFMNSDIREEVLVKIGEQPLPFRLGRNTWLTVVNPSFGENVDLILGTRGGGVVYLKAVSDGNTDEEKLEAKVYPNPSKGPIKILVNQTVSAQLISSLGQMILEQDSIPAFREVTLQTQIYAPGLYFLRLTNEKREVLVKKVLIR